MKQMLTNGKNVAERTPSHHFVLTIYYFLNVFAKFISFTDGPFETGPT